jgi:hypothetical protein
LSTGRRKAVPYYCIHICHLSCKGNKSSYYQEHCLRERGKPAIVLDRKKRKTREEYPRKTLKDE